MKKNPKDIKKIVRKGYAKVAKQGVSCCGTGGGCSCSASPDEISGSMGYDKAEMRSVPEGANLGLGCGNPVALAAIKKGDTVLDLGSGAGFDAFLAAKAAGKTGRVIGVDMTSEMLDRAGKNAKKGGYKNVEFRQGEIEKLPVEDSSIDVIISNCVINLSPDKKSVFSEAFRVLKPGGRLMVSDIVLKKALPKKIRDSAEAYVGCIAGAVQKAEYLRLIKDAGFQNVKVDGESAYPVDAMFEGLKIAKAAVLSLKVSAVKSRPCCTCGCG